MDKFFRSLGEEVPGHLHHILAWDFIPWSYVRCRHGDFPNEPLVALLDVYSQLAELIDLEALCSQVIPEFSGACLRCGSCCAYKRPGPVSASTYRKWEELGAPVARFYSPVDEPVEEEEKDPTYHCWFNNGTRLRLCPFLFVNRIDQNPFCAIHHLGDENRPPPCSAFEPQPPLCQTAPVIIAP